LIGWFTYLLHTTGFKKMEELALLDIVKVIILNLAQKRFEFYTSLLYSI